ncbi:MAG: DNA repair protein RadA [Chloroflexi bacterium]|nr:DNA repair protein RadA [Chloroflexota bacterium]
MARNRTVYVCQECGRNAPKPIGRCPNCGEWNSYVEQVAEVSNSKRVQQRLIGHRSEPQRLTEISGDPWERIPVPIEEFARVLGGGIVPGSIILIGGEPGIGKSTLLLQVAAVIANTVGPVLYVSGEESARQIKMRAERLDIASDDLFLVTETSLSTILDHIQSVQPDLLIVDSIQTTYDDRLDSAPGNVSQVKACATEFQSLAKNNGIPTFLVGHVTKEGSIAGPRVLEHIVDTVLYLEGDAFQAFRLLRSVKNRFGATSEVGVFEMQGYGMAEVTNPSEAFLADRVVNASGSSIVVTMEGTRPLLAEVQGLATPTSFTNPRRTANGVDVNRLLLLLAVLTRRANIKLFEQDVFVNVIGGLRIDEPAADLSIALAVASSVLDRPLAADLVAMGEVGLSGELRAVSQLPARLNEAAKLGFKHALVPRSARSRQEPLPDVINTIEVRTLADALSAAVG